MRRMKTFLVSDTHFGHKGMCTFTRDDGSKLRPWDNPDEMDDELVRRWNDRVHPQDRVYHLGDVVINRKALPTCGRLNGDLVLIKGNHDIFHLEDYTPYFRDVRAYHVFPKKNIILSHIPVHPASLYRWRGNIHGHLHSNNVMLEGAPDPRYLCVSMEHINYTPILMEDALMLLEKQHQG